MITRNDVITNAVQDCLKELYQYAVPKISWDDFVEENRIYSNKYKTWEKYQILANKKDKSKVELEAYSTFPSDWKDKSIKECIGPRPYEFYYIPREIIKDICDSYVSVYKMDNQQELLDTIEVLKNYCKEPIRDKYIEGVNGERGYRGYEHPDNLEKEINKLLCKQFNSPELSGISNKICDKFFNFLDMAGEFFNWNRDLNSFNMSVYLGPSPNSNKQAVIDNWKTYRNKDIEIDEEQIKKDFYGDDE